MAPDIADKRVLGYEMSLGLAFARFTVAFDEGLFCGEFYQLGILQTILSLPFRSLCHGSTAISHNFKNSSVSRRSVSSLLGSLVIGLAENAIANICHVLRILRVAEIPMNVRLLNDTSHEAGVIN